MKKLYIAAIAVLPTATYSQGLFDIAPNDEASESVRINYTVGATVGADSNISPGAGEKSSTTFGAFIGANAVTVSPRSTLEYYGRYQGNYYTDNGSGDGEFTNNLSGGLNFTYRASEKLRFASRNHLGYELEPDYNYGFANTRAIEEYLFWSLDNSFGYTWSSRFGMYAGFSTTGVEYGSDNSSSNRRTYSPYIQGRYQLNPRTVLTTDYRHTIHDNGEARDASSNSITGGIEHRLSPRAVVVARAGVQLHDTDGGSDRSSPYLEFAFRSKVSSRTSFRSFIRYGITNYDTAFGGGNYDVNENLRLGVAVTHAVSSKLSVNAGTSYINSQYSESDTLVDDSSDLVNIYTGFNYQLRGDMYLNGSVNATSGSSGINARDYDRVRFNVGLSYSF